VGTVWVWPMLIINIINDTEPGIGVRSRRFHTLQIGVRCLGEMSVGETVLTGCTFADVKLCACEQVAHNARGVQEQPEL